MCGQIHGNVTGSVQLPNCRKVDEAWLRQSRILGFENLDSWADPLESVFAHQAQTAAICWKFLLVNKHDFGWFVSESVAIFGKCYGKAGALKSSPLF